MTQNHIKLVIFQNFIEIGQHCIEEMKRRICSIHVYMFLFRGREMTDDRKEAITFMVHLNSVLLETNVLFQHAQVNTMFIDK